MQKKGPKMASHFRMHYFFSQKSLFWAGISRPKPTLSTRKWGAQPSRTRYNVRALIAFHTEQLFSFLIYGVSTGIGPTGPIPVETPHVKNENNCSKTFFHLGLDGLVL